MLHLLPLQSLEEKEKGNQAYKRKDFATALAHYDAAFLLDPTNVTFLTNKAGGFQPRAQTHPGNEAGQTGLCCVCVCVVGSVPYTGNISRRKCIVE